MTGMEVESAAGACLCARPGGSRGRAWLGAGPGEAGPAEARPGQACACAPTWHSRAAAPRSTCRAPSALCPSAPPPAACNPSHLKLKPRIRKPCKPAHREMIVRHSQHASPQIAVSLLVCKENILIATTRVLSNMLLGSVQIETGHLGLIGEAAQLVCEGLVLLVAGDALAVDRDAVVERQLLVSPPQLQRQQILVHRGSFQTNTASWLSSPLRDGCRCKHETSMHLHAPAFQRIPRLLTTRQKSLL